VFDIGFTEILVIGGITLIVVGPERLPETVRTVSLWIGRLKRSLRETKREIELQIGADDIRRELHNEEVMRSLNKIRSDVTNTLNEKIELDEDFYPPGHHDHDPNNDPVDDPADTLADASLTPATDPSSALQDTTQSSPAEPSTKQNDK